MYPMSNWANLPSCVLGLIFGCLDLLCGCGGGDGSVRLVCREWGMCRVICSSLKLCHGCSEEGVGRVLSGVEIRSVRRVCVDFEGRCNMVMGGLMRMELLEELSFGRNCAMTNESIDMLNKCVNLRILRLNHCRLVDGKRLCALDGLLLEELAVHECENLTRELLLRFGFLQKLSVSGCKLDENGMDFCRGFGGMKMLRDLNVSNCKWIDDDCVGIICDLVEKSKLKVEKLNLSCCSVSNVGIGMIGEKLKELRYLNLDRNNDIDDEGIMKLEELIELEELRLDNLDVTDLNLGMIGDKFKKLRCLSVSDCYGISDEGVKKLGELRELEELDLASTTIDGSCFENGFVKLRELKLVRCENINYGKMMGGIIGTFYTRKAVRVDICMRVNENVQMLMDGLKNVKHIFLSIRGLDDDILRELAKLCGLEKMDLSHCNLTADSLEILGTITSLRELNLENCLKNCDGEAVGHLSKLALLEKLWLSKGEVKDMNVVKHLSGLKYLCGLYMK